MYGSAWMEVLDQEICASLEEWMWGRWGTARLEEDLGGATASILWPNCQTKSHCRTWVRGKDPHDQALNEARETHHRALEATHLLEQNIERLSQAASRVKAAKCWHAYSCSHSRRRPQGRHPWSPAPWAEKACDFLDQEEEMSTGEGPLRDSQGQVTGGEEVEESDLWPPPNLEPELEHFLGVPMTVQGARDKWGSLPEPSVNKYEMCLEWQAHQVDLPDCWKELVTISNAGDPERLAQKIHASFEVPQVRCKTLRDHSEYTVPPCPKICPKEYVPVRCHLPPALSRLPVENRGR